MSYASLNAAVKRLRSALVDAADNPRSVACSSGTGGGAEAEYTEAIALNPSQENAHRGYATMLAPLEHAVVDPDPAPAYVAVEPRFATIRSDPRYARLLDLLGLS